MGKVDEIFKPPEKELVYPGHSFCPGCGNPIALRHALSVLGENTVRVLPASCDTVCSGFEANSLGIPVLHSLFASAGARASGVRAGLEIKGFKDAQVMVWAGDGGTFDIGFQALSAAAARNEDIIFVCYDNEAYMNTGVQQSGATPKYSITTVSIDGKGTNKKDIVRTLAGHNVPYIATTTIAFLDDLRNKFETAKKIKGFRFIHILSSCPTGWRMDESLSVAVSCLAVTSRVFPLIEVFGGKKFIINKMPAKIPLEKYLEIQGRFKHLMENTKKAEKQRAAIQKRVDREMNYLEKLAKIKRP